MEKEISERFVKLSSRVPYPNNITLGSDIVVVIGGISHIANCVKSEDEDNQDGTIKRIYKLKFLSE